MAFCIIGGRGQKPYGVLIIGTGTYCTRGLSLLSVGAAAGSSVGMSNGGMKSLNPAKSLNESGIAGGGGAPTSAPPFCVLRSSRRQSAISRGKLLFEGIGGIAQSAPAPGFAQSAPAPGRTGKPCLRRSSVRSTGGDSAASSFECLPSEEPLRDPWLLPEP